MTQFAFDSLHFSQDEQLAATAREKTGYWIHESDFDDLDRIAPQVRTDSLEYFAMALAADRLICDTGNPLRPDDPGLKPSHKCTPLEGFNELVLAKSEVLLAAIRANGQDGIRRAGLTSTFKFTRPDVGEITVGYTSRRGISYSNYFAFRCEGFDWDSKYRGEFTGDFDADPLDVAKEIVENFLSKKQKKRTA